MKSEVAVGHDAGGQANGAIVPELLRAILDTLPFACTLLDDQLRHVYDNELMCANIGRRADELVGLRTHDVFPEPEAAEFDGIERGVLATGKAAEIERQLAGPTGLKVTAKVRFDRLTGPDGRHFVRVLVADTTKMSTRLQAAIRETEIFRSMVDNLPISLYAKSADLRHTYVNKAWSDLIGLPCETAIGKTDIELMGADAEAFARADHEILAGRGDGEYEEVKNRDDGSVSYWIGRKRAFHGADGQVYLIGSTTDVTEMKRREKRYEESERENEVFRSMVDNLPISIYAKTEDLRLVYVNQAWSELVGHPMDTSIGKTDVDLLGPAGEKFADDDRRVLAEGKTLSFEETIVKGDNDRRYRVAHKRPFATADGTKYLIGSTTDVTDIRLHEIEAEQARKAATESFQLLADAAGAMAQGLLLVGPELIEFVSPKTLQLLDVPDTVLCADKPWLDFLNYLHQRGDYGTGEDARAKVEALATALKSGNAHRFERSTPSGRRLLLESEPRTGGGMVTTISDITEERLAQEKLRLTFERLNEAIEVMDDGFVIWDKEDRLVVCNSAFAKIFPGISGGIVGKTYRELVTEMARSGEIAAAVGRDKEWVDEMVAARAREIGQEVIFNTHDGRWIKRFERMMPGGDRIGIRRDITEQTRRETELKAAQKRAKALFDDLVGTLNSMSLAVVVVDRDLNCEIINDSFYKLWKIDLDTFGPGSPFRALMDINRHNGVYAVEDEGWEPYVAARAEEIKAGNVAPRHFERADGVHMIYSVTNLSSNRRLISYFDISEQKQREAQLEVAQLRSKALFDDLVGTLNSMSLAVVVVDGELNCEIINDSFYKLWKIDLDSFGPGSPFRALMDINRHNGVYAVEDEGWEPYVAARAEEIKAGNVAPRHFERADGVHMIYSVTNLSSNRRLISYFDISEQKQREAQLEVATSAAAAADRAKSEFLANMSHEIRTPMNGVMGMAELLAKTELDTKQRTFTDIIIKSGASLLTIINDILDFSKLDAGQMELDPAPFRLAEAIEDVATLVSSRVAEKDLELAVRIDPSLPEMFVGDVGRIRQVVTNLMGNAVKFTEEGHILVEVGGKVVNDGGAATASLLFRVEDTGIGIPEDKVSRVFEKFSQVDNSATRKHQGTGLGLAITRSLVELMGGEIGVESEFGSGTTFWFRIRLPVHGDQVRRQRIPVDVTGARILVVDDNTVNRAILQEQMAAWRFDSAACESGREAIAVATAAQQGGVGVDLVVLDYHMPEMDGGQVARTMRADPGLAHIPIIMLTSVDQTEDGSAFSSLGIQAHLMKPARSSLLLETIVSVLEEQAAKAPRAVASAPGRKSGEATTRPRPATTVATSRETTDTVAAPRGGSIDILVAEDNEVNQIVFTQILSNPGHRFHIVGNGALAIEANAEMKPKLILMDVSMPVMNGLDATREIRRLEAATGMHTPIIGVTAHAIKGDMEKCMAAGMDDYVTKPVSPDALLAKIEKWLARQEGIVVKRSA